MFCKEVDLPPIPEQFLTEENFSLIQETPDIGYGEVFYQNGKLLTACNYKTYNLISDYFVNWAVSSIDGISRNHNFCLQKQEPVNGTVGAHIVHSDIRRYYALNYMVETGGDNVITNWYLEKGKPLYRTKDAGGKLADRGVINYNNLELLDSVVMKKNKWYLLDVRTLHDVQNITKTRCSISIGFKSFILGHTKLDYFGV